MTTDKQVEEIAQAVLSSTKYRHVSPMLVASLARSEHGKGRSHKEAVKAVKNKLHQIAAAYTGAPTDHKPPQFGRWLSELQEAAQSRSPDDLKQVCRRIMTYHASTRERLPILDEMYEAIFSGIPPVRSIIDVACGLNPLGIPWMPLAPGAEYRAYDIYTDMMIFLSSFMGVAGVTGEAETRDVIAQPPTERADLVLVLKAIPCLEQVDKAAGSRLLDSLNGRHIVVSFPVASLGGKNKGMAASYQAHFRELAEGKEWEIVTLLFKTELVYLITTGS